MLALGFTEPVDSAEDDDELFDAEGGDGRRVTLTTDPSQDVFDRYGRLLAYVRLRDGRELGAQQLAVGLARVYVFERRFGRYGRYRGVQARARSGSRGVWRLCGGNFHRRA